jgi:uncharacterized protein YifE (UPF0438 family)
VESHFLKVDRGEAQAERKFETAWLKFKTEYPALAAGKIEA